MADWGFAAKEKGGGSAVRFSDDTARLQKMHAVRTSAVGSQMKDVIELLYKTRSALTAKQINEATYVDIERNRAVFESLRNNPKVRFDGRLFSYKGADNVREVQASIINVRELQDDNVFLLRKIAELELEVKNLIKEKKKNEKKRRNVLVFVLVAVGVVLYCIAKEFLSVMVIQMYLQLQ